MIARLGSRSPLNSNAQNRRWYPRAHRSQAARPNPAVRPLPGGRRPCERGPGAAVRAAGPLGTAEAPDLRWPRPQAHDLRGSKLVDGSSASSAAGGPSRRAPGGAHADGGAAGRAGESRPGATAAVGPKQCCCFSAASRPPRGGPPPSGRGPGVRQSPERWSPWNLLPVTKCGRPLGDKIEFTGLMAIRYWQVSLNVEKANNPPGLSVSTIFL
jgi:hypothetical protein